MRGNLSSRLLIAALLLGGAAGAQPSAAPAPSEPARLAQIMANRHAKRICSELFLAERAPAAVLRDDHDTDPATVDVEVKRRAGVIEVKAQGATGHAAHRRGLGCTILHRLTPSELRARSVA